ncbi:MAG: sporulation protein YabP [Lachnospiraceae bacterium]|nr:sporulation protein YabP [Lachnospiraceae bacterium]
MEEKLGLSHKLELYNREKGTVTGVLDVISFDENTIVLDTDMGLLTVKGKDLHVSRLSLEKGELDLEGHADSLVYSSNEGYRKSNQSLLSRLFK